MRTIISFVVLPCLLVVPLGAQESRDSVARVTFGGFVDGYFAWDFNRPRTLDRSYTTQPARHNEFNVNLAHIEAVLSAPRVRGRLALQVGTSVQANYAGEPRVGATSGSALARHLQEAVVGVRLAPSLWIDGGIYLSHIGGESWISRDNLAYTRSLIADYSPYYQSGVKLTWQAAPTVTTQLHVLNGWQNISENNDDKSIGVRVDWNATSAVVVSAYNLIGNERPEGSSSELRVFHGVSVKATPSERTTVQGTVDVGVQDRGVTTARWYGASLVARLQASPRSAFVARVERYDDPRQVLVVTEGDAFRVNGGSVGFDFSPAARALWRSELRVLAGRDALFPTRDSLSSRNTLLVSSLALTFD